MAIYDTSDWSARCKVTGTKGAGSNHPIDQVAILRLVPIEGKPSELHVEFVEPKKLCLKTIALFDQDFVSWQDDGDYKEDAVCCTTGECLILLSAISILKQTACWPP